MPGLFDPIQLRALSLTNRILVSPMCQYEADETGTTTDWHVVHYGSLALGGAALVMVEATAVESRGRISSRDVGLYDDRHIPGLARIVQFAHQQGVRMGVQLAHAGRKADLAQSIVAPSSVRFSDHYQVPEALSEADLQAVIDAWVLAARRAVEAGFDCVEIHAAHGYLLNQFLSPLSNQRVDQYGGDAVARLRFPLQVVQAVRAALPDTMPLFIRVSGSEYANGGYLMDDMIYYCKAFTAAGVDLIDVSGGGNVPVPAVQPYPGYQLPMAHQIRTGTGAPVAAVGLLHDAVLADAVIREGRADMIAVARGFLRDKHWGHTAAITLKQTVQPPVPYKRAYM